MQLVHSAQWAPELLRWKTARSCQTSPFPHARTNENANEQIHDAERNEPRPKSLHAAEAENIEHKQEDDEFTERK